MPIQYDINSIRQDLDRPENKELADVISKDLRYLMNQSKGLQANSKEYLLLSTVQRMVKIVHEFPMMIDGRNNQTDNSDVPF